MRAICFALIAISSISGCSGGIIGNLIPAPKILEGDITDSRYESPQKNFSVLTPFPEGSADFTYMSAKERSHGSWESVVFQSSTKPHSIYRIETGIAGPEDKVRTAEEYAKESFLHFQKRYLQSGMKNYEMVTKGKTTISGKPYAYVISSYQVPSRFLIGNLTSTRPYTGWSILMVHAQPKGVIYQSYDFEGECPPCRNGNLQEVFKNRTDVSRMINSLQVPPLNQ